MGTLVTFSSTKMLLQREDFPAALRAVKKIAKDVPGFFRETAAVGAATDLPSALAAGDFPLTLDVHGDAVGMIYAGDKWPPGAPDSFPEHLLDGLKKLLRDARFELSVEGVPGTRVYWVDRGQLRTQQWPPRPPQRFEQLGAPPRCRPGETVEIRFRLVSALEADRRPVALRIRETFHPLTASLERTLTPGEEAAVQVTLSAEPPFHLDQPVHVRLYGLQDGRSINGSLELLCDVGPEDRSSPHAVVATASRFPAGGRDLYLRRQHHAAALQDIRRHAARHAAEPGGAFLAQVAQRPDLASALRAASLEPTVDGSGHLQALAFAGQRLPGGEQHLQGMLASYAGLTGARAAQLRLAYAHAPDWWTTFVFDPGGVRRWREPRRPA